MLNANKVPSSNSSNSKRPDPVAPGTYPARLVQVVGLGTQKQRPYKGDEKPPAMMIRVTYELLDEFMKDEDGNDREDAPRWISEEFKFLSLKADLAVSTKRYAALDPTKAANGDWAELVGAPCMVTIINEQDKRPGFEDRFYDRVSSVSSMRERLRIQKLAIDLGITYYEAATVDRLQKAGKIK